MKKYLKSLFAIILIVTAIGAAACGKSNGSGSNRIASNASGEKDRPTEVVKIGIGYQTVTAQTWVQEHEGYTVAFLKALVKSHEFILENPEEAAKIFAEESGYDETVTTEMVKNIHFESVIYDKDIETMKGDLDFAISVGDVTSMDLEKFVDDSYLKMAYEELGIEYEGN